MAAITNSLLRPNWHTIPVPRQWILVIASGIRSSMDLVPLLMNLKRSANNDMLDLCKQVAMVPFPRQDSSKGVHVASPTTTVYSRAFLFHAIISYCSIAWSVRSLRFNHFTRTSSKFTFLRKEFSTFEHSVICSLYFRARSSDYETKRRALYMLHFQPVW